MCGVTEMPVNKVLFGYKCSLAVENVAKTARKDIIIEKGGFVDRCSRFCVAAGFSFI